MALYSSSIFCRSRAAKRFSCISKMAVACGSLSPNFFIKVWWAASLSLLFLMVAITSSKLAKAINRPSKICARSRASFSSAWERRVMTNWRWMTYSFNTWDKVISWGVPSLLSATMFSEKLLCNSVILKSLFKITFGRASFFNSTVICIPARSESSRKFLIPLIFLSRIKSAIFISNRALFTW